MAISRRSKNLIAIAARPDAFLIVDEAHTGVYGEQGRELTAPCEGRGNLPVVHTCGKALGAAGALVTASGVLRNLMVNRCRPFIFAPAPSSLPSPCGQPLSILQEESERQQHLAKLVTFAHRQMRKRGWQSPSGSQIVPCIVGDMRAQCGLPLHCRLEASISVDPAANGASWHARL